MSDKFLFNFFQVRTKTLVKNAIVVIDATPFRQWFEAHYALPLGHKKNAKLTEAEEALLNKKRSNKTEKKFKERQKEAKVQFLDCLLIFCNIFGHYRSFNFITSKKSILKNWFCCNLFVTTKVEFSNLIAA